VVVNEKFVALRAHVHSIGDLQRLAVEHIDQLLLPTTLHNERFREYFGGIHTDPDPLPPGAPQARVGSDSHLEVVWEVLASNDDAWEFRNR
jgi:hypothetical protein